MSGMEFNKIFAALLIAGIVAMLAGFFAEKLVYAEDLKENAHAIEVAGDTGAGSIKLEKKAEPILELLAEADIARGQKLSKACAACHSFSKGGANGAGPNLWGIVGREKQSVSGFSYSGYLNSDGINSWTYEALNKFLWKPKKYAPGTKMNYAGLKNSEDRAALVAWLRTLNGSPKSLPNKARIEAEKAELLPPKVENIVEGAVEVIKH